MLFFQPHKNKPSLYAAGQFDGWDVGSNGVVVTVTISKPSLGFRLDNYTQPRVSVTNDKKMNTYYSIEYNITANM